MSRPANPVTGLWREAEAVAQALRMTTADFERAFVAFSNRVKPAFQGN